eukprot:gene552-591_t
MKGIQSFSLPLFNSRKVVSSIKHRYLSKDIIRCYTIRKKRSHSSSEIKFDPKWSKVDLTSTKHSRRTKEEEEGEEDMERRLASAQNWEKFLLADDDAAAINKMIGFKEPVERIKKGKINLSSNRRRGNDDDEEDAAMRRITTINSKKKGFVASSPSPSDDVDDSGSTEGLFNLRNIRGFLDVNPYLCTGCGTAFQCKKVDAPGFLPQDKFLIYRQKAELIQKQQKAVKLLDMAGIELDSDLAEKTLREGKIEEAVIKGVRRLGKRINGQEELALEKEMTLKKKYRLQDPKFNINNMIGIINEIDPNSNEQRFISTKELDFDLPVSNNELWKNEKEEVGTFNAENESISKSTTDSIDDDVIVGEVRNEFLNLKKINSVAETDDVVSTHTDSTLEETRATVSETAAFNVSSPSLEAEGDDSLPICQRCFRLQQYGQVEQTLRPGWTENELLTPERFEVLLSSIKSIDTAVLCIIDIFDLHGSLLPNLKEIVGKNPLYIAVNKVDLLPRDISKQRVMNWVHSEVKRICKFSSSSSTFNQRSSSNSNNNDESILKQSNVHLISCSTGLGIEGLMKDLTHTARLHGKKIHVLGAANVGKSSFINRIMHPSSSSSSSAAAKAKKGKQEKSKKPSGSSITVSNLPGTTLDFLKIKLSNDITMIDTPGLINRGHLTSKLTTDELKQVIPAKPINAITLRIEEGKCILMGGLAKFEMIEGRPFFFTFYLANEIKIHQTNQSKADSFIEKHIGSLIFPPHSLERYQALQPFHSVDLEVDGDGWEQSSSDIVIPGLGWISVTGVGSVKVRVTAPAGTEVTLRPALLPFEAKHTTAKFVGGRLEKKSRKSVKTYGWRA